MRRRIEQLLNGKFEYKTAPLIFSEEKIAAAGEADALLTGTFTITAADEKKIKGFLYASNHRITIDPPQFYAAETKIVYQVDLGGLVMGDVVEGAFTVCTDRGEYQLPYCFTVQEELEKIRETEDTDFPDAESLLVLAKEEPEKARKLFSNNVYGKYLKEKAPQQGLVFQAVYENGNPQRSLEEFLIGCGLKDPVEIGIENGYLEMEAPDRSMKKSVNIINSGWGYLEMEISSDVRFLRPEKKTLTTDEFVNGEYPLEYIVDTNFLHAGKNYGRIRIKSGYQTVYLEVLVKAEDGGERAKAVRVQNLMRRRMLKLYLDFRMKRIEMQSWIDRSANVIAGYKRAGGNDVFADLFMVQLYFADGKRMKGTRLLAEIENHPERFVTRDQYAFYLYISTFFERDAAYVDQIEAKIEQLFLQKRDSWVIQWILLYLKERYLKDDAAKLEAIAMQVGYGCSSPIMYLEAGQILKKNPYLLRTLGDFELRILTFASKMDLLSEEICFQIANIVLQNPVWNNRLFKILTVCYEKTAAKDVLEAICAILIAGEKREDQYFTWYSLGVAADLRITGLYEYYMEAMDATSIEKMPQIIRMYFSYNNSLGYHKKAAIYRNISDSRDNIPQVYRSSRASIDHFVTEQLSVGHIDPNLAVLYERFITRRLLTPNLAEKLLKMLFTFEVTCKNPNMKSVVVYHGNLKTPQEVPFANGTARVQIYTEKARLFLVDTNGQRFASTSLYMTRRCLDSPLLLTYCRELLPEHPGLVLYMCSGNDTVTEETLPYYRAAVSMDSFTIRERKRMRLEILKFYEKNPRREELYQYLDNLDLTAFAEADKGILLTLLTQEGLYEKAFALMKEYGVEHMDVACMVRICSQTVLLSEYEENEDLVHFCSRCYQCGKYDDNILTYLLMYYDGPIEEMKRLWNTGHQNELDTMQLEEKILTMLLLTRSGSAGTERIFASYQSKLGRRKICMAYLILKSYEYLVKNLPVADIVFSHLEEMHIQEGDEMEPVCELALLQFYSHRTDLSGKRAEYAKALLEKYSSRGIRFAFFKRFPEQLLMSCRLEDRVFLEYVTDPSHEVTVHYRTSPEEPFVQESMKDCFEGIFVSEFILFEGESVTCYMVETGEDIEPIRSGTRVLRAEPVPDDHQSRYAMLSRMSAAAAAGNEEKLRAEMETYQQLDYLTKQIFTLI